MRSALFSSGVGIARRACPPLAAIFALGMTLACASSQSARQAHVPPLSDTSEIDVTLLFLGDAGNAAEGEPVLLEVSKQAAQAPERTVVLFLGDNVYPAGLPDSGHPYRAKAESILQAQIRVSRTSGARAIFVPGNHDWDRSGKDGWEAIRRQGRFIERRGGSRVQMIPSGGCPGPSVLDLGSHVRLLVLDTEWWLRTGPKPVHPTSGCPSDSEAEVLDSLSAGMRGAGDRHAVVVAHHPLATLGPHGGYFDLQTHVFPLTKVVSWLWLPLPVIGSAYPASRNLGITNQDLSGSRNKRMRARLDSVFTETPPMIYAAGHEHTLQILEGQTARYLIVSGASTEGHHESVAWGESTFFARSAPGFVRVDFLRGGRARLGTWLVASEAREEFSMWLEPDD